MDHLRRAYIESLFLGGRGYDNPVSLNQQSLPYFHTPQRFDTSQHSRYSVFNNPIHFIHNHNNIFVIYNYFINKTHSTHNSKYRLESNGQKWLNDIKERDYPILRYKNYHKFYAKVLYTSLTDNLSASILMLYFQAN